MMAAALLLKGAHELPVAVSTSRKTGTASQRARGPRHGRSHRLIRNTSQSVSTCPGLATRSVTFLEMAMEKEPDRRYATALEFAENLRRLQHFETIRARAAGPAVRFRRRA